jgi:hypothetical protein
MPQKYKLCLNDLNLTQPHTVPRITFCHIFFHLGAYPFNPPRMLVFLGTPIWEIDKLKVGYAAFFQKTQYQLKMGAERGEQHFS